MNKHMMRAADQARAQVADGIPDELFPVTELHHRPWMSRKAGKKVNKYTCIRWALSGKRGTRLRTTMVGGLRCTCDAWAWEFFEKLNAAEPEMAMSPRRRAQDHELAEAELAKECIC